LARDVTSNKKGFYRYFGQKKKIKEKKCSPPPPYIRQEDSGMENAEVLNFLPHFSLVVTLPTSLKSLDLKARTGGTRSSSW